jgi:hypothetical protein
MRRLIGLLGVLSLAALTAPAIAAFRAKAGRERDGRDTLDETADEIDVAAIFDALEFTSRSTSFRGGDAIVWYGGGTLDLREARLDPDGAELRVRAMFGGLEIAVPSSWPVQLRSRTLIAGAGDARDEDDVDPTLPPLIVDAQAMFGGVVIVAVPDDFAPTFEVAPAD